MDADVKIIIEGRTLLTLLEDLLRWEDMQNRWYDHIGQPMWNDWRESIEKSETRRESIVYGNCLATVKAALGRRKVNQLMAQMQSEQAERRLPSDPVETKSK